MGMIYPTKERYDPNQDLKVPGTYWMRCVKVEQDLPHWKHEGKIGIIFRFAVEDARVPRLKGKIACIATQQTIYQKENGEWSHLSVHAHHMQLAKLGEAFDPQRAVGQMYLCTCVLVDQRVYVRQAVPAGEQTVTQPRRPSPPPPPPTEPPIDGVDISETGW